MPYVLECVVGTLAAVGLICILKAVYDIIMATYTRAEGSATLVLKGDGSLPESERLLLAAREARRLYLPGLEILFLEQVRDGEGPNLAERTAARCQATYIK